MNPTFTIHESENQLSLHLKDLNIKDLNLALKNLPPDQTEKVNELVISNALFLKELPHLALLPNLKILNMTACHNIESLAHIEEAPDLERLYASSCIRLKDITALRALSKLQTVDLSNDYEIPNHCAPILKALHIRHLILKNTNL